MRPHLIGVLLVLLVLGWSVAVYQRYYGFGPCVSLAQDFKHYDHLTDKITEIAESKDFADLDSEHRAMYNKTLQIIADLWKQMAREERQCLGLAPKDEDDE